MNKKMKSRLIVVTGIIAIVLIVVLALVGGRQSAKSISISDLSEADYVGEKVQVSGTVVDNSFYTTEDDVLVFEIYDPEGDASQTLQVESQTGVSATFGNGVTAICTGKIDDSGVLQCSELVTKCPSKYENASEALGVSELLGYGDSVQDKPVKICGAVKDGSLTAAASAGSGEVRLVLLDADDASVELPIVFDGALSDDVADGSSLVVTGALDANGNFVATDVALEG